MENQKFIGNTQCTRHGTHLYHNDHVLIRENQPLVVPSKEVPWPYSIVAARARADMHGNFYPRGTLCGVGHFALPMCAGGDQDGQYEIANQ